MTSGLFVWIAGAIVLSTQLRKGPWRLIIWFAAWAATVWVYMRGYQPVAGHPSLFYVLQSPASFSNYVVVYLGAPFEKWAGITAAANVGTACLVLTVCAVIVYLVDLRRAPSVSNRATPWIGIVGYTMATTLITAIGRAGFGIDQALAGRYTTNSLLLWISLIAIYAIQLGRVPHGRWRVAAYAASVGVCLFFATAYCSQTIAARDDMRVLSDRRIVGARALQDLDSASDADLLILYPSVPLLRKDIEDLRAARDAPFLGLTNGHVQTRF
jgi:hypothetical protein